VGCDRAEESTSLIEVVSYQGQARTVSPGAERVRSTSGGWLWDLAQALVQGMNEVLNQAQACHVIENEIRSPCRKKGACFHS
jgi:hypothetical protein